MSKIKSWFLFGIIILSVILVSCTNQEHIYNLDVVGSVYKKNGKPYTGKVIDTDEDDNVVLEGYLERGLKNGTWKKTTSEGIVYEIENYKNGIKDGEFKLYFGATGIMHFSVSYVNGLKEGQQMRYYGSGDIEAVYNFKGGVMHGPFKNYTQEGFVFYEGYYRNGVLISSESHIK